jgi:hypothetical protein
MTAIFDLSPAWQVKDRFQFCAVNDSTAVELQHPRLFFCMENYSFSNSRRFFCGCFDIMNKNDAYEYRPGFAGERYV